MIGNVFAGSPMFCRKNPCVPITWPSGPPNAKAKPTAQYMMPAIEKFARIFAITVPAFFPREKPISRNAKPACMNITRQPATITQVELMPTCRPASLRGRGEGVSQGGARQHERREHGDRADAAAAISFARRLPESVSSYGFSSC